MKEIKQFEVEFYITEAIKNNLKNILFISTTCDTTGVLNWFGKNKDYKRYSYSPKYLYQQKNNRFVKYENFIMLSDEIKNLNNKNSVLFLYPFGNECIYNFDGFTNLIENREYVNFYPDGSKEIVCCKDLKLRVELFQHLKK